MQIETVTLDASCSMKGCLNRKSCQEKCIKALTTMTWQVWPNLTHRNPWQSAQSHCGSFLNGFRMDRNLPYKTIQCISDSPELCNLFQHRWLSKTEANLVRLQNAQFFTRAWACTMIHRSNSGSVCTRFHWHFAMLSPRSCRLIGQKSSTITEIVRCSCSLC